MVAGEVENPQRNLPIALILGSLLVITVYVLVNIAYFYVLPAAQILHTNTVASDTARRFLGRPAGPFIAVGVIISTFATLNGSILAGSRIPYARRATAFSRVLAAVHPRFHTPAVSLAGQGIIAGLFALTGAVPIALHQGDLCRISLLRPLHAGNLCAAPPLSRPAAPLPHMGISGSPGAFHSIVDVSAGEYLPGAEGGLVVGSRHGGQRHSRVFSLENMEAPVDMKCRTSSLIRIVLGVMVIAPWTAAGQNPPPAAALPASLTWTVVSTSELDARLQRQLEKMAAEDQAIVSYAKSAPAGAGAAGPLGSLVIELRQENAETFRDTLQRAAQQTAIALELARQGYVVEATYPQAAAPTLLRITAGSTAGISQCFAARSRSVKGVACRFGESTHSPSAIRARGESRGLRHHRGLPLVSGAGRGGRILRCALDTAGSVGYPAL